MAFFRFSRDKRGYEHFYLVEPVTNRKGRSRPRVLYWYRTPPNVKVGRVPFDDEMRRAIEAQYPDVTFDWAKIVEAPIPSADVEKWRERRRAERAEKAARRGPGDDAAQDGDEEMLAPEAAEHVAPEIDAAAGDEPMTAEASPAPQTVDASVPARKRRRRRRGRGPAPSASGAPVSAADGADAEPGVASADAVAEASTDSGSIEPAGDGPADEPAGE